MRFLKKGKVSPSISLFNINSLVYHSRHFYACMNYVNIYLFFVQTIITHILFCNIHTLPSGTAWVTLVVWMTALMGVWVLASLPLLLTVLIWHFVPNLWVLVWIYLQGNFLEGELLSQRTYKFRMFIDITKLPKPNFVHLYVHTACVQLPISPHHDRVIFEIFIYLMSEVCVPVFSFAFFQL